MVDAFSEWFEWTTPRGKFRGMVFADTARTWYHVRVEHWCAASLAWTQYNTFESREVTKVRGNTVAEFQAWRVHATGYEPDMTDPTARYLAGHESYAREAARWSV